MSRYQAQAERIVNASREHVYALLRDYEEGHPRILPPRYFEEMRVEMGGKGEGTIVAFQMNVLGTRVPIRAQVSEPEPGRILEETDLTSGAVTTFQVIPVNGADQARVIIATRGETSAGLRGTVERWLTPLVLRRIYRDELEQLATVVSQ